MKFKKKLALHYLLNLPGWHTNRKIVVIESDDWGSIRMPSREVYNKCLKAGYPVNKNVYERYDSLASEEDIELLFGLLVSFKDKKGNHPVITANCVVANPDFEKIKADNFKNYHYELITETFKRYPKHFTCFDLWKKGMEFKIFHPQYHAREHLNVSLFMDALRKGNRDVRFGFDHQMPGCIPKGPDVKGNDYIEATKYTSQIDKTKKIADYLEGLDIFEKLFNYRSETVIPPNYIWSPDYNEPVFNKGVTTFQGIRKICEPVPGGKNKYHTFFLGTKNKLGQIYLIRNAFFEPSLFRLGFEDPIDRCLSDITIAFRMQKPAVICSHRINYVGFIDQANRDRTLRMLNILLTKALRNWPDIEFLTSDQLGNTIKAMGD